MGIGFLHTNGSHNVDQTTIPHHHHHHHHVAPSAQTSPMLLAPFLCNCRQAFSP